MVIRRQAATTLGVLVLLCAGCGSSGGRSGGSADEPGKDQKSVIADANRLAPALESAVRGTTYPMNVDEAKAALAKAGLKTTEPNTVGGYRYDADTVEFVLCIQGPSGAFASYDTRPMSLFKSGPSGGCPA